MSERKNRHLLDIVRSLRLESSVPPKFWPEALSTAVHVINRLSAPRMKNEIPYFCLFHKHPTYSHLHTFGCVCFVLLPPVERTKPSTQSSKCAFLGYANNQKGFLCYVPKVKRIRISRNVVVFFFKSIFFPTSSRS